MSNDAQEYLNQVRQIDEQMRIIQSQIRNIVELSGLSYDKIPSQSNGDSKVERMAMRRVELLDKYETKQNELLKARYQITDAILTLKGRYQQEILFKRYVELKRWEKISREMALSLRQVHYVHKEALHELSERLH